MKFLQALQRSFQRPNTRDLRSLRKNLRTVGMHDLSQEQKAAMKQHLMGVIQTRAAQEDYLPNDLEQLSLRIQRMARRVFIPVRQKALMKERIFAATENSTFQEFTFGQKKAFHYFKTVLSSAMLFFFVVTSVVVFPFNGTILYAARSTYLDDVQGDVFVIRNGQLYPASKDFSLQESDILLTKEDSFAVVRFFDDSVVRMDANTQLELKRMYSEPFNPVATQVEVSLENGRLWTHVLNLVDERAHFSVATDRAMATVSKKAAFDLQARVSTTTLSVFDNVVDFSLKTENNKVTATKPVLSGFKAEVAQTGAIQMTRMTVANAAADQNDSWIQSNLEKDKAHDQQIAAETEKSLENTTDNVTPPSSTLVFDKNAVLSNDDLEAERVAFLESYHQLLVGETYLVRQQQKLGLELIVGFKEKVQSLAATFKNFEKDDPLNVGLLRSLVEAKIAEQRKDLANFLPWDALYPAKQLLEETELLLAKDEIEMTALQLSQAESKLFELQDLVDSGNFDQAAVMLLRYKRQVDQVALPSLKDNESQSDRLNQLFSQEVSQMKVLTLLEKSLGQDQASLLADVRTVRHNILQKLIRALKAFDSAASVPVLQDLKALLETYATAAATYDKVFVSSLNKMLDDYQRQQAAEENAVVEPLHDAPEVPVVQEPATPDQGSQTPVEGGSGSGGSGTQIDPPKEDGGLVSEPL